MKSTDKIKQKSIFTILDKNQSQINGLFIYLKTNNIQASLIGEIFDDNRLFFTIKVPLSQFDYALTLGQRYIIEHDCKDIIVIPKTTLTNTSIKPLEKECERSL